MLAQTLYLPLRREGDHGLTVVEGEIEKSNHQCRSCLIAYNETASISFISQQLPRRLP